MKFSIDILHPAHVHVFKHFIKEMESRGHSFLITSRKKDCTVNLLEAYKMSHITISHQSRGPGLAKELISRTWRFYNLARSFKPDYLLGIMGPTIALAGKFLPSKTVIFYDTEMAKITNWFAYPLADVVVTPRSYQGAAGRHHVRYPGYHELAYLHPNRFTPDPDVVRKYGLSPDEPFFLVRFVSWEASHDLGESGFSLEGKKEVINRLRKKGRVLISSEGPLPQEFESYRFHLPVEDIHHALALARLIVGESATMSSEAAVLGTHAIFVSKTARGYTDDQERRYGLVHNFKNTQEKKALILLDEFLGRPDLKADSRMRQEQLLAEHIDVTSWMIDFFENGVVKQF